MIQLEKITRQGYNEQNGKPKKEPIGIFFF